MSEIDVKCTFIFDIRIVSLTVEHRLRILFMLHRCELLNLKKVIFSHKSRVLLPRRHNRTPTFHPLL